MARQRRLPIAEINVVPYIDVMLVLLVIFMAVAPILTQGVQVNLPKAPAKPLDSASLDDPLIVTVRADGALFLNVGGPDERGNRVTAEALEDQAARVLRARPDVPVLVRGDSDIDYGRVIEIMALLQRAGASGIGLITQPPELVR
jgi:biopolymer transport protein TolR